MVDDKVEFTFGISIDIYTPAADPDDPPHQKKFRLTGRFPSPALPTLEAVASAAVDFFNVHLGTRFSAVETFSLEELEEVAPGEYQLKEGVK